MRVLKRPSKNIASDLFANSTLEYISNCAENGTAKDLFKVGDTKKVYYNGEPIEVEIIAFEHDDLADGSGKAGMTLGVKVPLNVGAWGMISIECWGESEIKYQLHENVLKLFEQSFIDRVKEVTKTYFHISQNKYLTSTDKLFLLSTSELGFTDVYNEGEMYPIFKDIKDKDVSYPELIKYVDGVAVEYWTRSRFDTTDKIYSIGTNGELLGDKAKTDDTLYAYICFCL